MLLVCARKGTREAFEDCRIEESSRSLPLRLTNNDFSGASNEGDSRAEFESSGLNGLGL